MPVLPQPLLNLIAEYGLARTDGVSDVERLHRWQLLIDGIKDYAVAALSALPAGGGYKGPAKFTPDEIEQGNVGIRWVTQSEVAGRPALHDLLDYVERRGEEIACTCARCKAFPAAPQQQENPK